MEPAFADYLKHYTNSPAERATDRSVRLPFMRRLLPVPRAWEDSASEDTRILGALTGAFVANGLECKLSCSSSKVGVRTPPPAAACLQGQFLMTLDMLHT